jgi:(p)ppGpp synthase/HD superfamily hydrolase
MATLEKAIEMAARAHAGQRDRSGVAYVLHPLRVMLRQQSEEAMIVAVLHDTLEDTELTEDDLRRAGFSEYVLEAVRLVTHDKKKESYADYVAKCAAHPLARAVKLADLEDNSRLDRAMLRVGMIDRDLKRIARYQLSYRFLTGGMNERQYREAMKGRE